MPYDGTLDRDTVAAARPRPGLLAFWTLWRARAAERREAAQWSERDLRDVGLTSGDVWRELHRPLRSPPGDPRRSGV